MVDYARACAILRACGEDRAANVLSAVAQDPDLGDLTDDHWWQPEPGEASEAFDEGLEVLDPAVAA